MKLATRDLLAELIVRALDDTVMAAAVRCLAAYCHAVRQIPPSMAVEHFLLPVEVEERERVQDRLETHPFLIWDLREGVRQVTLSPAFASEWPEIATKVKQYGAVVEEWKPNNTDSPLTYALRKGVLLFNHRLFFEVHEVLEAQWLREAGDEKQFLQGLIQVAVAFHHLGNKNLRGALSLLHDGVEKIAPYQPVFLGIELQNFIAALQDCRDELLQLGDENSALFHTELIPRMRFVVQPA
jgi:hypothetical protein